ncbi:hypothetical protein HKX69_34900 [Streptomyces argyrophyllae]|uniref:Uncharacterized protein n=1 Tax=Streptomyces argyrophylli TaxID=2726118 RepID=A0A6M4PTQ2_9ACTN|nr:hypothetical protein [Streptomyces argyrophyllae]QJS14027.1 hypothetical protein HKX69_34900 [Streptomyces argyrophyllae]
MKVRSTVVTAVVSAAAAVAATGITYASAASASVPQEAPAAVAAVTGGNGNGNGKGNEGNNSKGNEGRNEGRGNEGRGNDNDEDNEGGKGRDEGRIQVNERSYSTHPGDCITVVSGLGAKTLNVRNESRKTVEVFRGAVCDNGAPIATVGPHSSSYGVKPDCTEGIDIEDGVVASFRVIKRHHDEY